MATTVLRPDADVTAGWTESSGTTAWNLLDDAVTDPTDAQASGDGGSISTSTAGAECEVHVASFTLGTDEVSAARLKTYLVTGAKRQIEIRLLTGTTQLGTTLSTGASAAEGWYTLTYTGALTQAQIDDLRAEFICRSTAGGGGAGSCTVYAAYVEVDHAAATVEKSGSDSASASDANAGLLLSGLADTASTSEGTPALALGTQTDAATGSEQSPELALSGSDSASADETASVVQVIAVSGTDAGAATEQAPALAQERSESALASDAASLAASLSASASATAAEGTPILALTATEVFAGTDVPSLAASPAAAESATSSEGTVAFTLAHSDAAAVTDSGSLQQESGASAITAADALALSESAALVQRTSPPAPALASPGAPTLTVPAPPILTQPPRP